jgi:hypothetical protein
LKDQASTEEKQTISPSSTALEASKPAMALEKAWSESYFSILAIDMRRAGQIVHISDICPIEIVSAASPSRRVPQLPANPAACKKTHSK